MSEATQKTQGFEEYVYSRVSNRKGGRNKRGGWEILAKIINLESAINEEVGKNLQVIKRGGWNKREAGKNTAISIVSMEKFMLPRNMLNIIVFCKAQHNA